MSQKTPDAWDAEWTAETIESQVEPVEPKKAPGKVSKAQKRAQQAEFNRQLWQQAEGPQETNYFLESRNVVPLRSEFKPPPILLSRKGPSNKPRKPLKDGLDSLSLQGQGQESSSEDEDAEKQPTLAERQAQATKDREEKQRKYEERRQELFGSAGTTANKSSSGKSSPANLTPPTSRSATPNRGRGNGRGRGGRGGNNQQHAQSRTQSQGGLFEPAYAPKPDSTYLARRENGAPKPENTDNKPQRTPKGPDGSGRGGFGFAARGGGAIATPANEGTVLETT